MYAVVKTGGKQYRVSEGDQLRIEKIPGATGEEVTFEDVLMIGGTDDVAIGKPCVTGASVSARILEQGRGRKVVVFKYKRRKGFQKKQGHRQAFTRVQITGIHGASA
ncbi:MAG: 50S ribosomal protein L21 [Deltaproteobacteria bacterium]|nr:50S ribosomal protein L21 [Deltaproteobacteria bacterium]